MRSARIVLVNTSHPGNIGAAARAMKNMGLSELCLVDPQVFPSAEATARASGADDLLSNAQVVDRLDAGLGGASLVIGGLIVQSVLWLKLPLRMNDKPQP